LQLVQRKQEEENKKEENEKQKSTIDIIKIRIKTEKI